MHFLLLWSGSVPAHPLLLQGSDDTEMCGTAKEAKVLFYRSWGKNS